MADKRYFEETIDMLYNQPAARRLWDARTFQPGATLASKAQESLDNNYMELQTAHASDRTEDAWLDVNTKLYAYKTVATRLKAEGNMVDAVERVLEQEQDFAREQDLEQVRAGALAAVGVRDAVQRRRQQNIEAQARKREREKARARDRARMQVQVQAARVQAARAQAQAPDRVGHDGGRTKRRTKSVKRKTRKTRKTKRKSKKKKSSKKRR